MAVEKRRAVIQPLEPDGVGRDLERFVVLDPGVPTLPARPLNRGSGRPDNIDRARSFIDTVGAHRRLPPDQGQGNDILFHRDLPQLSSSPGDLGSLDCTSPALVTLRGSESKTRPAASALPAKSAHSANVSSRS